MCVCVCVCVAKLCYIGVAAGAGAGRVCLCACVRGSGSGSGRRETPGDALQQLAELFCARDKVGFAVDLLGSAARSLWPRGSTHNYGCARVAGDRKGRLWYLNQRCRVSCVCDCDQALSGRSAAFLPGRRKALNSQPLSRLDRHCVKTRYLCKPGGGGDASPFPCRLGSPREPFCSQ